MRSVRPIPNINIFIIPLEYHYTYNNTFSSTFDNNTFHWHRISSDQHLYSVRERTRGVKETSGATRTRRKKGGGGGGALREKLRSSLDSLVSVAGPRRRGNAVTDNGTLLRRRSPM